MEEEDKSQKTEDPTQKKLEDAIKKGDVAKSLEVNTWFVLAAATLVLAAFAASSAGSITMMMRGLVANAHMLPVDGPGLADLSAQIAMAVTLAMGVPMVILFVAAVAGNLIQHRLVLSGEQLKPKVSKISPIQGFKRLFGKVALVNFAKGIVKIVVIGGVMVAVVWPDRTRLDGLILTSLEAMLPTLQWIAIKMIGVALAVLFILAAADFAYQNYEWYERQRMSVREVRDEYKQTEGDPTIKAKLKQIRSQRARKRMMAQVPTATVVVTNPTHFAVALKYESGMSAPLCVAKGVDALALRIRAVATDHDVPIVENPPLARALHATVEIDQEIPEEHYRAVAEVIGYVMKLKRGN